MGLSWDQFTQSWKCMGLKFTGEFSVMTMKNETKFEEELTCQFKIDMGDIDKFWPEYILENPKNLHFNRLLLAKVYNAWAKISIEELCLMALKTDAKCGRKTDLCFLKIFVYRLKISISMVK